MPYIGVWRKSKRDSGSWSYADMNITATIDGSRGGWEGRIEDNEFNGRFNVVFQEPTYTRAKNRMIDEMRAVHREISKR